MKHKKQNSGAESDSESAERNAEKIEELTNDLKRVQAEFENFKKRTEKESRKSCDSAKSDLMKKLLPVIDAFESALKTQKNKGLELIYTQLMKTLHDEGLSEINAKGKFNPDFHEAMLHQQGSDFEDDEIVEIIQKGYRINGCIIRHAKVKINTTPNDGKDEKSVIDERDDKKTGVKNGEKRL